MPNPEPLRGIVTAANLAALYADADVFPYLGGRLFPQKSAAYDTKIEESLNSREVRLAKQDIRRISWVIKHEFVRDMVAWPELQQLWDFHAACMGRYGCFYFYDNSEPAVTNQQFGTGDGVTKTFTIVKPIGKNAALTEPVRAFWNTPSVTVNGTANTQFTIAPWGAITFTTAPANGAVLRWSGQPLYVCRFDDDEMGLEQLVKSIWAQDGLTLKTLRP